MQRFSTVFLAVFLVSWVVVGSLAAPTAHVLARRSLLWPGRNFGASPWGVVLGPPPSSAQAPISGSQQQSFQPGSNSPAANAAVPASVSTPASTPTPTPENAVPPALPTTTSTVNVAPSPANPVQTTPHTSSHSTSTSTPAAPSTTSQAAPHTTTSSSSAAVQTTSSQPSSPSPTPSSTPSTQTPSTQFAPPSDADIQAYLKAHNDERAKFNAAPLTWSTRLFNAAQTWANNCQFKHSANSLGPFGENLAAGSGSFSIAQGVGLWNAESKNYTASNPVPSHWTQVVWQATTQLGCAKQTCAGIVNGQAGTFIVCEYFTQGNVLGEFSANVDA